MKFLTKEDFDLATDGIEQLNRLILDRDYVTFDVDCLSGMLLRGALFM